MTGLAEEHEWERPDRNWRGIGLTDPIKNVEVSKL